MGVFPHRESGDGRPVVFVHGLLCNGAVWRDVVARLEDRYRCIVPELPLGAHAVPAPPGADLSPPGLARTLGAFLAAHDLRDVTLVANDYGGALTQLLLAGDPSRVGRVLLTSCDSYGQLPPRYLKPVVLLMRLGLGPALLPALRIAPLQRVFWRTVAHRMPPPDVFASYFGRLADPRIAADLLAVGRATRPRYTLRAARRLQRFAGPAIVAWGADDLWFARRNGRRLARAFPRGRFVLVEGARTFVPEDAPARVAELVEELMQAG